MKPHTTTTIPLPAVSFAIVKLAGGWHRWCNLTRTWTPLPAGYRELPEQHAREYAAGFYGIAARQVQVQVEPSA